MYRIMPTILISFLVLCLPASCQTKEDAKEMGLDGTTRSPLLILVESSGDGQVPTAEERTNAHDQPTLETSPKDDKRKNSTIYNSSIVTSTTLNHPPSAARRGLDVEKNITGLIHGEKGKNESIQETVPETTVQPADKSNYPNPTQHVDINTTDPLESNEGRADYVYFETSSDVPVSPSESSLDFRDTDPQDTTVTPYQTYSASASSSPVGVSPTYSTMSWLDSFMYQHRGSLWTLFNTFFMVIWILVGILALYRLLGLPWCSLFLSRTQYLVIHLLIFTAATFEFVQLIHLSYGSYEGLPLFLTLLLTHTPTPCLAVGLIIMTYCIFVSTRVPIFGNYSPPLIYISILGSFVIVLSFVGDILVGVSRNSVFLIIVRVSLIGLCLAWLLTYIFNYKKIVGVALLMRREFRGELKSLAMPVNSSDDNHDTKLHLKKVLLTWSRITLVSCLCGLLMCIFSFCLSLFFTVSFVPLWAFWILHSAIFVSQILVVICLTFGAAFTLTYSSKRNIFFQYFFPSVHAGNPSNGSFIKRGNFIYQRVSAVNGPTLPQVVTPIHVEDDELSPLRNNNIITELSAPPYKGQINLKRSATFNCVPPYGFHGTVPSSHSSNLYPVVSDHDILPYSNFEIHSNFNNIPHSDSFRKPSLHISNSFNHSMPEKRFYPGNCYGCKYPMKSFLVEDHRSNAPYVKPIESQSSVTSPSKSVHANSSELAGTVEALEIAYTPMKVIRNDENRMTSGPSSFQRRIPHYHSFSAADRRHIRHEPPEKPARKAAEPILVKGVIKDNAYVENVIPIQELADINAKRLSSNKDPNFYSLKGNDNPPYMFQSPYASSSIHTPEVVNSSDQVPLSKNNSNSNIQPKGLKSFPVFKEAVQPTNQTVSLENGACSPEYDILPPTHKESLNEPNPQREELTVVPISPTDNSSFASSDVPDLNASFDAATLPIPRNCALKRNHSTAGDFSTPLAKDNPNSSTAEEFPPKETNGLKEHWYGTWGGRRKSKKQNSTSDSASVKLRRFSTSKSSLSSIYERLKTKRSKSMYQSTEPKDDQELSSAINENQKEVTSGSDLNYACEEEEEEEFFPKLEEDIDLASEILKSSSVLADFYSLKRSDLKKRKNARNGEGEAEDEEVEENGEEIVKNSEDENDRISVY